MSTAVRSITAGASPVPGTGGRLFFLPWGGPPQPSLRAAGGGAGRGAPPGAATRRVTKRQQARRAGIGGPSVAATDVRPERYRSSVYEVGSSSRISGQPRPDRIAGATGGVHGATWAGLPEPAARGHDGHCERRSVSDTQPT